MRRDDDLQPTVMLEEWLLALRGPADLDPERVVAARVLVDQALLALLGSLEADLDRMGVRLELSAE